MAERRDANFLEIVTGQPAQQFAVDVVGTEQLGILGETDPAEPTVDVQDHAHGLCQRQSLKRVGLLAPTVIPKGFLNQRGVAMWTPTTREQHSRTVTRYQTDVTDAEWRVIMPHLPNPAHGSAARLADARDRQRDLLCDAVWLPVAPAAERLAAVETIYRWFAEFRDEDRLKINHALVMVDRERVGRDASPTAAIIDSQSVKTTEAGGPRGYDAGKKINGRKRHALVDTDGRGLVLEPHPASVQDRDGGGPLAAASRAASSHSSNGSSLTAAMPVRVRTPRGSLSRSSGGPGCGQGPFGKFCAIF